MADKRIQDLPSASSVQLNDLFVLEQNGAAMNLSGQTLVRDLATALDGHGGIANVTYTPPVAPSLNGTLTLTMADQTSYDVTVTDGNGIVSIAVAYGIASNGTDPAYVSQWSSAVIAPTSQLPYQWTRITITDKTGNATVLYSISSRAIDPTINIGTVMAEAGTDAAATVTNSGTAYNPTLNFDFTLPQGEKGDTGDYIEPVLSYGTSTASASEPSTWYSSPSSISYAAGNFIWRKTEYVLHTAQTVQSTKTEIIGYIGQNGTGAGTVTQITFNNNVYTDDGTGNVDMNINAADVGAIADPANKANGQVLTYDSTAGAWVASNPSTGNVNTVNNVGVTAGTTNIQLYGTNIPVSSSDSTPLPNAIPQAANTTPANLGTAAVGSGTTWARADHVHNMPSASDVGAIPTDDVQYKIYDSVTDLGLTSGSATIAGAYSAMSDKTILICNAAEFESSAVPSSFGTVIIKRTTESRTVINFYSEEAAGGDYRMFCDLNTNLPTGVWIALPGAIRNAPYTATHFSNNYSEFTTDGHSATFSIAATFPAVARAGGLDVGVIPEGYRPPSTVAIAVSGANSIVTSIEIYNNGVIRLWAPDNNALVQQFYRGCATFFIN